MRFPPAVADPALVGTYPASVKAGGGYVWDAVLEYRVWCYPGRGAPDECDGNDYYHVFETGEDARAFAAANAGTGSPLALVLQREYIDEPTPGHYVHVQAERLTEWQIDWLRRPRRTPRTIPDFLAPDAPPDRLERLRGLVP